MRFLLAGLDTDARVLREAAEMIQLAGPEAQAVPVPPKVVPGRCICGRTISLNKPFCRACGEQIELDLMAQRLARSIPDQETLDKALQDAGGRAHLVMERIRPYLRFKPNEVESRNSETCPVAQEA